MLRRSVYRYTHLENRVSHAYNSSQLSTNSRNDSYHQTGPLTSYSYDIEQETQHLHYKEKMIHKSPAGSTGQETRRGDHYTSSAVNNELYRFSRIYYIDLNIY